MVNTSISQTINPCIFLCDREEKDQEAHLIVTLPLDAYDTKSIGRNRIEKR